MKKQELKEYELNDGRLICCKDGPLQEQWFSDVRGKENGDLEDGSLVTLSAHNKYAIMPALNETTYLFELDDINSNGEFEKILYWYRYNKKEDVYRYQKTEKVKGKTSAHRIKNFNKKHSIKVTFEVV